MPRLLTREVFVPPLTVYPIGTWRKRQTRVPQEHVGKSPCGFESRRPGEHTSVGESQTMRWGSSPHAQGALDGHRRWRLRHGIIPSCAGNTSWASGGREQDRDHLRLRGEHDYDELKAKAAKGSSPHARGTLREASGACRRPGIIPACAGNTGRCACRRRCARDHSRMRGEHGDVESSSTIQTGSPPHARGTHALDVVAGAVAGITPACAGNTPRSRSGARG